MKVFYAHQRVAFHYTNQVQHPALFMDMRLGKTLVTVRRLTKEFSQSTGVLIVAPYCALYSWEKELREDGIPDKEMTYLTGTKAERFDALCNRGFFCFINKEGFLALPEIARQPWDAVVCDESTFLKSTPHSESTDNKTGKVKSHGSKVTKFFCSNFRNVKRRFILTGTPAPESDLDLFQQLQFLDPQILQEKSYWSFRYKWFTQVGFDWRIKPEGKVFLEGRLKRYCFSLSRKDVQMEVRKIYERRVFVMPANVKKIYRTAEKDFLLKNFNGEIIDETVYAIKSYMWLRRIAGGVCEDGSLWWNDKLRGLVDLLTGELRNSQVVVWFQFLTELYSARDLFLHECRIICGDVPDAERVKNMKDYQRGDVRLLFAQPECFKYGVDLSCADAVVYYSSPLGLETRLQSEDRAVNIHTKNPVLIIDMTTKDTVDEDIYFGLQNKETRQEILKRMIGRR